jgi:hypothetical protein
MTQSEREFITELIIRYKPKCILEVGVAAGSSSVVIANSINDDSKFYSFDYNSHYYRDKSKNTGFILNHYPILQKKNIFDSGGYVINLLKRIDKNIDFCLIDTVHSIPGEILDFLMILPFLSDRSVVCIHDTNLHTFLSEDLNVNNLLISAIKGNKLINVDYEKKFYHNLLGKNFITPFPNICAVEINRKEQMDNIFDIFNLLTQRWKYLPSSDDIIDFRMALKEFYSSYYCNFFDEVLSYQKERFLSAKCDPKYINQNKNLTNKSQGENKCDIKIKKDNKNVQKQKKQFYELSDDEQKEILKRKRKEDPYKYFDDAKFLPVRLLKYFYKKKEKVVS